MPQDTTQPPVDALRAGETRLHISLPTGNLTGALDFYRTLFDGEPTKRRGDYAKFEPDQPRVNLSLVDVPAAGSRTQSGAHHFGLQVDSTAEVERISRRMRAAGLAGREERETTCCYAVQDKVWFSDPDGNAWEVYVVHADAEVRSSPSNACCVDAPGAEAETRASCC